MHITSLHCRVLKYSPFRTLHTCQKLRSVDGDTSLRRRGKDNTLKDRVFRLTKRLFLLRGKKSDHGWVHRNRDISSATSYMRLDTVTLGTDTTPTGERSVFLPLETPGGESRVQKLDTV